jgi:hypothetical protein
MDEDDDIVVEEHLYWEETVYSDDASTGPQIKTFGRTGTILGIDRCSVTGQWHILVAGHDGRLHTLVHDDPTLVYVGSN